MTNVFMQAAADDIAIVSAKEAQISGLRDELNPEVNKVMAIANLAVVAKGLGLDAEKFAGRKKVAGQFRDMITDAGVKEAKAKLLAENAIKMARHEAFAETVAVAAESNDAGAFAQSVQGAFADLEITTQSRLVKLLNPKVEFSLADQFAISALKAFGQRMATENEALGDEDKRKGGIKVTAKKTSSNSDADAEAVQLLLDAAARIDPRVKDVAATLVDAINNGGFEIEVQEAA